MVKLVQLQFIYLFIFSSSRNIITMFGFKKEPKKEKNAQGKLFSYV